MSVVKFIELSGRSSESFEDAVRQTVERASRTIRNIQSVWVKEFEGVVENNRVIRAPGDELGLRLPGLLSNG
jgi:flavin-binding protein dodecin